jgi:formiminotetrahydrofolate cyclodeaminase
MITAKPLHEVLAAFASARPTPAGGSASALASAVGVSLLVMAARLSEARSASDEDRQSMAMLVDTLSRIQGGLTDAIDDDADAYNRLIATKGESRQAAVKGAIDVPVRVMRLSVEALRAAPGVASRCPAPARSDVRVGVDLLHAGLAGARSSAQENLPMVSDASYAEMVKGDIERLSADAASVR